MTRWFTGKTASPELDTHTKSEAIVVENVIKGAETTD